MRNLWEKKIMNNLPGILFFLWGCVLLGVDGKVKKRWNEPSFTFESAFFSKITPFHSSTMLRTILTQSIWYLDLFRDFFLGGGGVSMGVYKFYLGPHKSEKKEKYSYSNFLQHTVSIMCTSQCRILTWSRMWYYLTSWPLPGNVTKYQEISARAATKNRNKTDYALTLEKYMYDTTK